MSTIDTSRSYVIQGQTLQNICDAVKTKTGASSVNVSDLESTIRNIVIGIDWVQYTGNPNAAEPDFIINMLDDIAVIVDDNPDWSTTKISQDYNGLTDFVGTNATLFTKMVNEFDGVANLRRVILTTLNNLTNLDGLFQGCRSLVEVTIPDTSSVQSMSNMFAGCSSLISAPSLETGNASKMMYMFAGCKNLEIVPVYDGHSWYDEYSFGGMFSGCDKLSLSSLRNILIMCAQSSASGDIGRTSNTNLGLGLSRAQILQCQNQLSSYWYDATQNGWYGNTN